MLRRWYSARRPGRTQPWNSARLGVWQNVYPDGDEVNYVGYDAIKPFRTAVADHYFPYTPNWQGTAGLNALLTRFRDEFGALETLTTVVLERAL